MKKLLVFAICIILVLGTLGACSSAVNGKDDFKRITEAGELVIGITDYAPMNYYDDDGTLIGFDTEYAEKVCEELGVKPKFVEIDWDNKEVELKTGQVDCLWNGVTYDAKRDETMDFSKSYIKNDIVIVVKSENADKYKSIADLNGLKIAAEGGSSGADAVTDNEKYKDDLTDAQLIEAKSLTASLMEVSAGKADAAAVDSTLANELVGKGAYADLTIVSGLLLSEEVLAIAFRDGSDLPAKVDAITKTLDEDGFMAALAEKYNVAYEYK